MWRAWRWGLLLSGVAVATAFASLFGAWFGGDVPDRDFYKRHPVAYDVLEWSFLAVALLLAVGGVGGVVRLVRVLWRGLGSAKQ